MTQRLSTLLGLCLLSTAASSACGGSAGSDGSELLVAYSNLNNGIIFATHAIPGSAGYDLFWIPIPDVRSQLVVSFARLTDSNADERQPTVSRSGTGLAFASDDGIFISLFPEGRIKRVSDTRGTNFDDTLPALSANADRVAWVRADKSKPIGTTGLFETFIMIANADGTDQQPANPKPGIIQDAPAFDPNPDPLASLIAWSEFAGDSLTPGAGPTQYGVYVFDYRAKTGDFRCRAEGGVTPGTANLPVRNFPYRCFGQHLVWPRSDFLLLAQDMLEIHLDGTGLASLWGNVVESFSQQQLGIPELGARGDGFFPAFPISASYDRGMSKIVFDGVVESLDGDQPSLALFLAATDGSGTFRIQIDGLSADIDLIATANYLFSVATPQFISF